MRFRAPSFEKDFHIFMLAIFISAVCYTAWVWHRSDITRYPTDDWWWEGTVAENILSPDGDQDLLTEEGYYLVLDQGPYQPVGTPLFILQASKSDGQFMTYHCPTKDRSACHAISQVITFPHETYTTNQGVVPVEAPRKSDLERLYPH